MKKWKVIFVIVLLIFIKPEIVMASENNEAEVLDEQMIHSFFNQMDIEEIDQCLEELFPNEKISFQKMVMMIIKGDIKNTIKYMGEYIFDQVFFIMNTSKKSMGMIVVTAFFAAIFKQITSVFTNEQLSKNGFYVFYMLMVLLCFGTFISIWKWIEAILFRVTRFMSVFYPVFFVFVAISKGSISATAFYQLVLFLIFIVELLIGKVFMRLTQFYMIICLINELMGEDNLGKFCEFVETMISWGIKSILAGVIGLSMIQGMIGPSLDQVKRSIVTKGVEAIPGIGSVIGGSAETVLALASLIKNGVGIAGAIVCILLCIIPLLQITFTTLAFHLMAALLEPVSDDTISNCIMSVSKGCKLLMKIVYSTGILFLTTIIIVSVVTNHV